MLQHNVAMTIDISVPQSLINEKRHAIIIFNFPFIAILLHTVSDEIRKIEIFISFCYLDHINSESKSLILIKRPPTRLTDSDLLSEMVDSIECVEISCVI